MVCYLDRQDAITQERIREEIRNLKGRKFHMLGTILNLAIDDRRYTHAVSNAKRDQAIAKIATFQLV